MSIVVSVISGVFVLGVVSFMVWRKRRCKVVNKRELNGILSELADAVRTDKKGR